MRRLALLFAILALGFPAAASAQSEADPSPAASPEPSAPAAEATPAPVATPVASATPEPSPAAPVETAVPVATTTPPGAAEHVAPAPTAGPARTRSADRPVRPRRHRARRRANVATAQGEVEGFFGGRVTVGAATATCYAACKAAPGHVDVTVVDVKVRAEPEDDPQLTVTRAEVTGREGRVKAHVVLRPPGADPVETDVELAPGEDLMDPRLYAGDAGVADAFGAVGDALGTAEGSGRPLAALTVVFGNAAVSPGDASEPPPYDVLGTIGISTASSRAKVALGVVKRDGEYEADPPEPVEDATGGSGDAPRDVRAESLYAWLKTRTLVPVFTGGGGPGGIIGGIVGTITAGACRAFAGENCSGKEARRVVQFVVSLLHGATLFATADGKLQLQVRCPSGFGAVTGSIEVKTAPRLGVEQVMLGDVASFDCGKTTMPVTVELTDAAQRELERSGHTAVQITVLARSPGHFDGDVVDLVLELRSS